MPEVRKIAFAGDMDFAAKPALLAQVDEFLSGPPAPRFEVDLSAVTFMDSSGMAALLLIRNHAVQHDTEVALIDPPRHLRRAIDFAGLTDLFVFASSDDDFDELHMMLPAAAESQRFARAAITERWPALDVDICSDLLLIVSELVSNAVQHGRPEIEMWIRTRPLSIDVSVLDHGDELPPVTPREIDRTTSTSGRGLAIIERLSNSWGIRPLTGKSGKTVWATLSTA